MEPFADEQPKKTSRLDRAEEALYSRSAPAAGPEEFSLSARKNDVRTSWGDSARPHPGEREKEHPAHRFLPAAKKIFWGALVFFALAAGVALYVFFAGGNTISAENVSITVNGPVSVGGGQVLSFEVTIHNENNTTLIAPDLLVEYPDGTKSADDVTKNMPRFRESLPDLGPGEIYTGKMSAVLFGQEGDQKEIALSVEYRVKGSNAIFYKDQTYDVAINSSPVTMTVDAVKEANAGQSVTLSVNVVSNSSSLIHNALLVADFPFGFAPSGSDPAPTYGSNAWSLGDLKPGSSVTVKVSGKVSGADGDERLFKFSIGTEDPINQNSLAVTYLSSTATIMMKNPFVGISVALNGDESDPYIATPGGTMRVDLGWSNDGGTDVRNAAVSVQLAGNIFDPLSVVTSGNGFYRSTDNTILWDQTLLPDLAFLKPGDTGATGFSFSLRNFGGQNSLPQNPQMTITVSMKGSRLNDQNTEEDFSSSETRTVKLSTTLRLSSRLLHFHGPFTNSGPVPPRANTATTYTVVWSLTNTVNDVSNVKVSATLPSYVSWLGVTDPATESVQYNPIGGEVEWDPGTVAAGTGFSGSPRSVSFQVSFTPGLNQIGIAPTIMSAATATGDDTFANVPVESSVSQPLTSDLSTDVGAPSGSGTVSQ